MTYANPLAGINVDLLLRAIVDCESNGDATVINPRSGARGLYQFREATWKSFGKGPHLMAHNPATAHAAARRYLAFLATVLLDHSILPTAERLATMWNMGTLTRGTPDYATRVASLYTDYVRTLPAALPPTPLLPSSDNR